MHLSLFALKTNHPRTPALIHPPTPLHLFPLRAARDLKQHNRLAKTRLVDRVRHHIRIHIADQKLAPLRAQRPQIDIGAVPADVDHALLAGLLGETGGGGPVLEEIVQAGGVDEDLGGVEDAEAPRA